MRAPASCGHRAVRCAKGHEVRGVRVGAWEIIHQSEVRERVGAWSAPAAGAMRGSSPLITLPSFCAKSSIGSSVDVWCLQSCDSLCGVVGLTVGAVGVDDVLLKVPAVRVAAKAP